MKLTVVHLEGSKQGLTETLTGEVITIGRDPSNSLSFDPFKDLDVSARHATVSVHGGQAMLQYLGSTNGTFLNEEKVTGAVILPNGCLVRFGENGPKLQLTWSLAEEAGELGKAAEGYQAAFDAYQKAGKTASNAALAELRKQLDQASKQASQSLAAKEQKDKADRACMEMQNAAMLAKLKEQLEASNKAKDLLRGLAGIDQNDPNQLDQGISSLEAALAAMPADSPERKELEDKLAAMKKQKEELGNVSERLQEAAKAAKDRVVSIHCKVVALPKGQRKETTKIRVTVAESNGTGFWASANGRVVTAKEVAYPEKFDPKAAALKAKLDERGMSYYRELTVATYDGTAKVYSATHAADKVAVAREFDDAFGPKETVKIPFDNSEIEVTVRPHERSDNDVVVLQVDGVTDAPFLEVAEGDPSAGQPLVALGTQKGEDEKVALFMFEGKVQDGTRVLKLEVPSFSSWIGGPLLNPDGKVIGIIVAPDTKLSKGVAGSVFAPTLE